MIENFEWRPARLEEPLLNDRDALQRQLDPEVAAGDHDPGRGLDDLLGVLGRLRLLDLRDQRCVDAVRAQALLDGAQVVARAHEGHGEHVDVLFDGEVDPLEIGLGNGRQLFLEPRQVDPLVRRDRAAGLDLAQRLVGVGVRDPQPDAAVGEVDEVALVDRPGQALP